MSAFVRLRPLLAPDSVAIVGASTTPGKYGHTVVRYLQNAGFKGRIYPINPEGGVHAGLQYYKALADVPERIDCAYSIVPADATVRVAAEAAEVCVRALIIGASGFAEMATDRGRERQAAILESATSAQMIILGPNTNGIWNAHHGLALGFNTSHGEPMVRGPLSVAAHSGALFDSFLPRLKQLGGGFSKLVPLGNAVNLDMLEVLEAFIEDPETGVIGLIMEAIRDGARLRALAARAHAVGKPIFVLKLGRSAAGATAAIAHSSRLAGSFRAYEALLRECGIPIVRSIETLAAVCTLASDKRALHLKGDTRLIGVSGSGGGCSLMADHAAERGIALAGDGDGKWSGETARVIAGQSGIGLVRNPIDGGNLHGWDKLPALLDAMDRDGLGGPVAAFAHRLPTLAGDLAMFEPLIERKKRTGAPVVVVAPGTLRAEIVERCRDAQIALFSDLATCFDSLRAIYEANTYAARYRAPRSVSAANPLASGVAIQVRDALAAAGTGMFLSEIDSSRILRLAGVPMVETRVVASAGEACDAATAVEYPVVLKAIAPGIAHKNDAGLVAVGIADGEALVKAHAIVLATAAAQDIAPAALQVIVQPRIAARAELIAGTTHEPGLGHFLVAGLGGVNAELLDSVLLIPMPAPRELIESRLKEARFAPLLAKLGASLRVDPLAGFAAVLDALQSLVLAMPEAIQSIDVNPVLLSETGCVAVDALIVPRHPA